MIRLLGTLGAALALYALVMLAFDGFGSDLSETELVRYAIVAFAGALLAWAGNGRRGGYPWWKHTQTGEKPGWVDVAKHAIDADRDPKSGEVHS